MRALLNEMTLIQQQDPKKFIDKYADYWQAVCAIEYLEYAKRGVV